MATLNTLLKYFPSAKEATTGLHYAKAGLLILVNGGLVNCVEKDEQIAKVHLDNELVTFDFIVHFDNEDEVDSITTDDLNEYIGTIDVYDNVASYK